MKIRQNIVHNAYTLFQQEYLAPITAIVLYANKWVGSFHSGVCIAILWQISDHFSHRRRCICLIR